MERRRHGERICEGVHGDLGDREPLDRAVEMADALSGSASSSPLSKAEMTDRSSVVSSIRTP
jgi:hypothetical protein